MEFKVMSFNIRGAVFEDGANEWPKRAALNVRVIQDYAPDMIGFQEWQVGNREVYAAGLTGYDHASGPKAVLSGQFEQFEAIYWRRDRWRLVESGGFYLSETPEEWSQGWDASLVRVAHWARLRTLPDHPGGQGQILLLNTHLDHIGHQARLNGAGLIVERLASLQQPDDDGLVVCGDFNDPVVVADAYPDAVEYAKTTRVQQHFLASGWRDTFIESGGQDAPAVNTFHDFKGADFEPVGLRIDWVLIKAGRRPIRTRACEIITDAEPPIYPSDHYPLLATLALGEAD